MSLKGPTDRILKETTNEVIERETIRTVEVAPKVGSVVNTPTTSYITQTVNKSGYVTSSRSSNSSGKYIQVRQRRGKPDGSDRRLKKNIMSIGEFL